MEVVRELGNAADRSGNGARIAVLPHGVFLTVQPGSQVDQAGVAALLSAKGIVEVDGAAVQEALSERSGQPRLIAPRRPELDNDASVTVSVDPDGMRAVGTVVPARGGAKLDEAGVMSALAKAGVTTGIQDEAVAALVAGQRKGGSLVLAVGALPVTGKDGSVEYLFATDTREIKPTELDDGRVDYYNLRSVDSVSAGQIVARLVPPTPGAPGYTVRGEIAPAKQGREARLLKGKNVEIAPDGASLVATSTGHASLIGNRVSIFTVHEVRGDVDFATGNIDFVGSVIIYGGVQSGFSVKAGGDIEIRGPVDAATISAEGNIYISRGVQGGERGRVTAGGDIHARFIQQCTVHAGGNVQVDEAIMYSNVAAGGRVEAKSSKGRIVGGSVRAGEEVATRVIGSKLATKTEVEVGARPETRAEFNEASTLLQERQAQLTQVQKGLEALKQAHAAGRKLTGNDAELGVQLAGKFKQLRAEVDQLHMRRVELEEAIVSTRKGIVKAYETVHPGVKISIGPLSYAVRDELSKPLFYVSEGEIRVGTA